MPEFSHYESVRQLGGGVTLVAVMNDGSRTPLPSFRDTGSPAAGVFRDGPGGGGGGGGVVAGNIVAGSQQTPTWDPNMTFDPQTYTKEDLGELDADELHGKPAPAAGGQRAMDDCDDDEPDDDDKPQRATSSEPGGKLGGDDDDEDDRADKPADDTDDADDNEEQDSRSVSERLLELRSDAELPHMATVDQAMSYLKQLA